VCFFSYTWPTVRISPDFSIINFPYLCSNIPSLSVYSVYIWQLIWYARACSTYNQFLIQGSLLTNKLMSKEFLQFCLQTAFHKFYYCYNNLVCQYNLSLGQISYQPLSHSWHPDFDYGSYGFLDLEIGLTAGVGSQQGMLTPPRHLIPPLNILWYNQWSM
jgi:hypothetical protein